MKVLKFACKVIGELPDFGISRPWGAVWLGQSVQSSLQFISEHFEASAGCQTLWQAFYLDFFIFTNDTASPYCI
jgi:hypothetical protein